MPKIDGQDFKPNDRIRVKHADTGHHSTVAARTFNPAVHTLLKSPAKDKSGRDVPPKYHVTKSGSPAAAKPPTGETPAATRNEESQK